MVCLHTYSFSRRHTLGSYGDSEKGHIWMSCGGFSLNVTRYLGAYRLAGETGSVEWADMYAKVHSTFPVKIDILWFFFSFREVTAQEDIVAFCVYSTFYYFIKFAPLTDADTRWSICDVLLHVNLSSVVENPWNWVFDGKLK